MGGTRYSPDDWKSYSKSSGLGTKTSAQIFTSSGIHADLDPSKFKFRESCDSDANPNSTPIAFGLDVTASMLRIPPYMITKGFPTLMELLYGRKPVSDPHFLAGAVGDVDYDCASLQVSQFEADAVAATKQMEKLYLEGGGGGNGCESYQLFQFWTANCTKIDSFDKHGRKGILITVGDEDPMPTLSRAQIERVLGSDHGLELNDSYTAHQVLDMASKKWEVFHLVITEGSNYRDHTLPAWQELIGERAIKVTDHTKIAEVVVSVLEVFGGKDAKTVSASWDESTSLVVSAAVKGLKSKSKAASGVATL